MLLPSIRSLIVSTSKLTCPRLFVQEFLSPTATEWNQNRGRKRNFKTGYSKEVKRLKRIAREEKEQKRKENKQRFLDNMTKGSGKKEIVKRITLRYEAENEVNLPDVPLTDVYFRDQVKTQFEPLRKALETYRMLALNPIISNRKNALLKLRCELNMTAEKTGKFVSSSQELVLVPHPFSFSERRILMAFIKDKILAEKAKEAGAELILGPDSIRKILKGQIKLDDYDFCLAYSDMASTILPLRGVLRYRYPNKLNGALTDDIVGTIEQFKKGVKINIVQSTSTLSWGTAEIVIGRLNMTDDEIEANVKVIIQALCKHRNLALGPFINRARLICRGVRHPYSIDLTEFMPVATEEQLEKMGRKKKKKKEKKEELKEKENQEIIDPFIAYM